jgi:cytochrome b561
MQTTERGMQTGFLLNQHGAREMALAPVRNHAWTHDAPTSGRRPSFDQLTISLHWVTVVLVLTLFASAWLHGLAEARQSDLTQVLLQIHRSFGLTVWVVTVLRLAWRLTNATLPPFPAHMTKLHRATVKLGEYGLYALLLGQPATGLLTTVFSGRPFSVFLWVVSPLMPRDDILRAAFHLAHEVGAWTLAALVLSHAAAALFHHFVLRDDVLECMAPAVGVSKPSTAIRLKHASAAAVRLVRMGIL